MFESILCHLNHATMYQMRKMPLIFTIITVLIFILVVGLIFGRNFINSPTTKISLPLKNEPADQAIQEVIEANFNQKFLPKEYRAVLEENDLARLGFGKKNADNFRMDWHKNGSYFLTFVGYEKSRTKDFVGYTINIYIKGVNPKGSDAARAYLKNIPSQGWQSSSPKTLGEITSEISTTTWNDGHKKIYLEVLSLSYKEPQLNDVLGESVKEMTVIRKLLYTPNNPEYGMVDEFQHAAHTLYGR